MVEENETLWFQSRLSEIILSNSHSGGGNRSYYASTAFHVAPNRIAPPLKRQRLMTTTRNGKNIQSQKTTPVPPLDQLKVYSNQDILICGNCRELFSELNDLLEHKKTYCKLRFTCRCDTNKSTSLLNDHSAASLLCVQCKDAFPNAWDLMVHAQAAHMLNIYELGVPTLGNCSSPPLSPRDQNSPDKDNKNESTGEIENGHHDHDQDFLENGRDGLTNTPDSANSANGSKELDDLIEAEEGEPETCIVHALSIVSAPAARLGTHEGEGWNQRGQTAQQQPF